MLRFWQIVRFAASRPDGLSGDSGPDCVSKIGVSRVQCSGMSSSEMCRVFVISAFRSRKQTRKLSSASLVRNGACECSIVRNPISVGSGPKGSSRLFRASIKGYGAREVQARRPTNAGAGTRRASVDTSYRPCGCAPSVDDDCRRGATHSPSVAPVLGVRSGLLAGCAAAVPLSKPRHRAPGRPRRRGRRSRASHAHGRLAVLLGSEHAAPLASYISGWMTRK
jgi:hypothetical protein